MLTYCDQLADDCWCFLRPTQVSLSLSGYRWNPSIASKSAKGLGPCRCGFTDPDTDDFRIIRSRCISLAEFKPSKEANVIVSVTSLGSDPGGFSTWVLYGRVFNGGQTTARNVVVRYRVRDARGIIYANGEILPAPHDIPPLTFAEYRGQIVGSAGGSDRWVETEAKWSKD